VARPPSRVERKGSIVDQFAVGSTAWPLEPVLHAEWLSSRLLIRTAPSGSISALSDLLTAKRGIVLGLPYVMAVTIGDGVTQIPEKTATMTQLPDGHGGIIAFEGELLASESSREPYGDRSKFWREIAIYRRTGGAYVVHSVGRTSVPGKIDRHSVFVATSAAAVYEHLVPAGQRPRFLIADVLQRAGALDPALAIGVGDQLEVEELDGPPGTGDVVDLPRANDRWLRFIGTRLAHATSWDEGKPSWTEIEIYRTGGGRYVVFKAQRVAAGNELKDEHVWVVQNGREALTALIRPGVNWIEAAALDAIDEASSKDRDFSLHVGNLLKDNRFRELLPEMPWLSSAQRNVLRVLDAGARLVTETTDAKSRVVRWAGKVPLDTSLPMWPLFLKLSRQRLVRTVPRVGAAASATTEWEISTFGRRTLNARASRSDVT